MKRTKKEIIESIEIDLEGIEDHVGAIEDSSWDIRNLLKELEQNNG